MSLLARAREAGLAVTVEAAGDLVVRGPKRLAALAAAVLKDAEAVRDVVRAEQIDTAVTITAALRDVDWIVVYSTIVDAEVVFIRDADVEVSEYAGVPTFTVAELAVLAGERPSAERLRAIVDMKRAIPGGRLVADPGEPFTPVESITGGAPNANPAAGDTS